MSPSSSTTRLTCISPLPDIRRDSVDEQFLNTLNLPAPKEFADPNSRRCSAAQPTLVEENEDSTGSGKTTIKTALDTSSLKVTFLSDSVATTAPTSVTLENDTKPILFDFDLEKAKAYSVVDGNSNLGLPTSNEGDYVGFTPIEVLERNLLRQQQMNPSTTNSNNSLQVPSINVMDGLERLPIENVYVSDNITIIDTDAIGPLGQKSTQDVPQPQQHSSSDEQLPGEASDLLSTISNEECSVKSEILDRPSESSQIADIIQDLDFDQIGHIDSPDASDNTDMLHGESLLDDVSSLLGQDLLGALQDCTMTDDSTLCTLERERSRRRSLKQHLKQQQQQNGAGPQQPNEPHQYGFENRLFDLTENRTAEPKRYPSLAQFDIENDIARKSFKRQKSLKSASFKRRQDALKLEQENNRLLDAIQIQIQGSHSDLSEPEQETVKESRSKPPNLKLSESNLDDEGAAAGGCDEAKYSKEISEKDEIKKKRIPHISFVIEPPSPSIGDQELRSAKVNEIRRHSSHTPSLLAPKDIEMNRRHSGNNPNLLGLDREHVKFLNCSPAATRRISVGSLFKPNEGIPLSLGASKSNMYGGSTMFGEKEKHSEEKKREREREKERMMNKRLPIINPLVQLPSWPSKYKLLRILFC